MYINLKKNNTSVNPLVVVQYCILRTIELNLINLVFLIVLTIVFSNHEKNIIKNVCKEATQAKI